METSWKLPKVTRTGKIIDSERLLELYRAGIKPEDAFNVVLGSHKDVVFIDRVLYTPLTEKLELFHETSPPKGKKLVELKSQFKSIILDMYDGFDDDLSEKLVSGLWPKEENKIKKRPKTKDVLMEKDESEDGIFEEVYGLVRNIAELLYQGGKPTRPNEWTKINTTYQKLVDYLQKIIEDPTPNKEMRNIVDRMGLMSYSYEVGSFKEIEGSRDESVLKELFEPSKVHPSIDINPEVISEYGYIKISDVAKPVAALSDETMSSVTPLMIEEGKIQIEEDSFASILREADVVVDDFSLDFISGKD